MNYFMMVVGSLSLSLLGCAAEGPKPEKSPRTVEQTSMKILFDFRENGTNQPWRSNNDGVMGGLSTGGATMTDVGMTFSGVLSLENNGGFSMVQQRENWDLSGYQGIRLKVRGDGRTYQLRLNSDARFRDRWPVSFSGEFETKAGEWVEVEVSFDQLRQSWRGRTLSGYEFNPAKIEMIGILLADKNPGPFKMEVEWIAASMD